MARPAIHPGEILADELAELAVSPTGLARQIKVPVIGPRGGDTGKERTIVRGEPAPPTPKPGQSYKMHRPAHNGAGRGKK